MTILQLQAGDYSGADAPIVRLSPSVVRKLGRRASLQVGAIAPVSGDRIAKILPPTLPTQASPHWRTISAPLKLPINAVKSSSS